LKVAELRIGAGLDERIDIGELIAQRGGNGMPKRGIQRRNGIGAQRQVDRVGRRGHKAAV
jgi:hypothetical protein